MTSLKFPSLKCFHLGDGGKGAAEVGVLIIKLMKVSF